MSNIIIYHGSKEIIEKPEYGKGNPANDYGLGFYCTCHLDLAKEWACDELTSGYANKYQLDLTDLSISNLSSPEYTILNWLALLLRNRKTRFSSPIEKRGAEYLVANFLPDYENADIIIGYRADDSYFSFARSFVANTISLAQLEYAMKLGELGEQYVMKSPLAFDRIKFISAEKAERDLYYPLREKRDHTARTAFFKELEHEDANGIYMRDIIKQEIKNDDPALR